MRAVMATFAPRASSSAAMALPMPRLPPVTSAVRPVRSGIGALEGLTVSGASVIDQTLPVSPSFLGEGT
ncbi:MAG: hypothetical protein U5N21_26105 [Rhodococcus sp. (in: high G+C Gram-positive bacteria)]|nr:hypothetical protein [Rhodococcus sp. (in: high G+C Gram-positive bacteria)]